METLKFAAFGAGFWSNYQIAGWLELDGLELVAICDPDLEKAKNVASKFDIPRVYSEPIELFDNEVLDFVDIITDVDNHLPLTRMAASKGVNVVCQKPMAPSLQNSYQMLKTCEASGVQLFINENFRWQAPIRKVKDILDSGQVGNPFKGRVTFCSAFPVFENQPFLKELDRFILTDIGSHTLDICRFLFGEVKNLRCLTTRVNSEIAGEDVATVLMEMVSGLHCFAEMSYASILEQEVFPETLLQIEATDGTIELAADLTIKTTTSTGTNIEKVLPERYSWNDPDYALIHSSIVEAQQNILSGLRGGKAETTGRDNYETTKLIWACYHSAENGELVEISKFGIDE